MWMSPKAQENNVMKDIILIPSPKKTGFCKKQVDYDKSYTVPSQNYTFQ